MRTREIIKYAEPLISMKIATYNVNSIRRRLPIVLDWLAVHKPDVMCLQETKIQDQDFPVDAKIELCKESHLVPFKRTILGMN